MLQQNSYRNVRYRRWLAQSGDAVSIPRCIAMVLFMAGLVGAVPDIVAAYLVLVAAIITLCTLVGKRYKKPLVVTSRVTRLYVVMWAITLIVAGLSFWLANNATSALLAIYCFAPLVTMLANWLLTPVQALINRRYYNDARRILRSMPNLTVIGITGSYGKTSTKHYLHAILSEQYETVMTPGSFNTTLGVVRTIREYLHPYTEVFIAEMGAKQKNDIKEICDLVNPTIGIVTAVGPQHLESFKTIENVRDTKFELVDALPANGFAVINDDFEQIAGRRVSNTACVRYGIKNTKGAQVVARDIVTTANGTDFVMEYNGVERRFHTRLLGECNVSNLIAAIVTALYLNVDEKAIARAVERIEPVEHRLSTRRTPAGVTIIDDAFNSNPSGSAMALDVLSQMTNGKRIIITPGMIELGEQQYELNKEFGRKIATGADVAMIVGEYNREAITEGIAETEGAKIEVHTPATFAEAQQILQGIVGKGDTVLYENDLPDTFK